MSMSSHINESQAFNSVQLRYMYLLHIHCQLLCPSLVNDDTFELVTGVLVLELLAFLSAAVLTLTAESFIKILS